jgi:GNAT superfamily N-acetyltransferase
MEFRSPGSEAEWQHADVLIGEMKEWDVVECRALGFSREEVVSTFYCAGRAEIRAESVPPDGCFLLALEDDEPLGCAAFHRLCATACELYDVYVRPAARGRRIATLMVEHLLRGARAAGYQTMCLETATFMVHAHKVYRSHGFHSCQPYREIPAKWDPITLWMECDLRSS